MGPIDYNLNVQDPFQSAMQGFQTGAAIKQQQQQQLIAKQQQEAQKQMQMDLAEVANNPNAGAQDYSRLMTKYPQLSEHFKRSWDVKNADQQKNDLQRSSQVYSALIAGQPGVAMDILSRQAEALKNSGKDDDAKAAENLAEMIRLSPQTAKTTAGLMLSSVMGADKFAQTFGTVGEEQRAAEKQPYEVSKVASEAAVKEAEAGNVERKIGLENMKAATDIESTKLKQQIDQLDTQIKQANSETDRGRLQLERDKLNTELQTKLQTQQQDAQNQIDTVNNSLNTVKAIMKHPVMSSSFGVGSTIGKALSMVPGTENKDFDSLIETLKSQQFLTAAKEMKGMGALSDAEGARIERAVASLDRNQSPKAFKTALSTIQSTLERAQAKIVGSNKLSTKGGAHVMTHPVYGDVTDGTINSLLKQFPGATRDQVINYLQQSGGK